MAEENARFLGTIPELYDRHLGPVIFAPYADDLAKRVAPVTDGPVLELACGTGILTEQLRLALSPGQSLMATDLNPPMIEYARRKLDGLPSIHWRQADAQSLPFDDGEFDAVVCQFGFMFVPDKTLAFKEARRVLMEGGLFAFSMWGSFENNDFGRLAHQTIASFFSFNPPDFYQIPFGFHDRDWLGQLLDETGFRKVQLETVTLEANADSARSFAIGLVQGNPVSLAIEERGLTVEPVIDALEDALTAVGGREPFRSSMQAVVATARR